MTSLIMAHISHISHMLFLRTTFKAVISCACCVFLHHRCNISYFRVGPFTFPRRAWGLSAISKYFFVKMKRRSRVGQRLTGPVTVDSGKGLKQKKIWDFMANKTDTYRQVKILLLGNKVTYSRGDDGEGVRGRGVYPRPQEGWWNLLMVIIDKNLDKHTSLFI